VPAALYSVFAGELVRGRTFRRRFMPEQSSPRQVLTSINTILHDRQLEEYYCTLCYAVFDLKRKILTLANSGLPYPVRVSGETAELIELPGVPLGSFVNMNYDELSYPLHPGDVYVFCSDGVSEAMNERGEEFGPRRVVEIVRENRSRTAGQIVRQLADAVAEHRAGYPPNDDMTIVALRLAD
jgi:sigma-B regulation protein RsbU (phosphoserine phosphatase)